MTEHAIERRAFLGGLLGTSLGLVVGCAPRVAVAQPRAGAVLLGQTRVVGRQPTAHISVRQRPPLRAVQLRVREHSVQLSDLRITFGNGDVQRFAVTRILRAGEATPWLDLPGGARVIRSLQVVARRRGPRRGAAIVRAWGV